MMNKDTRLIYEAWADNALVQKAAGVGANVGAKITGNKFVGKAINAAAGTTFGQKAGGAVLDQILPQLSAEEKQWLAANIDDDAALQKATQQVVDQSAMQKVITNIISQPNIKQIVKQKLGVTAA